MIGMRIKKLAMYPRRVTSAVYRATDRNLSRFGAFVMTRARRSIKPAPKSKLVEVVGRLRRKRVKTTAEEQIAPPGQPPYSHKGGTLKRFIRFAVDRVRKSVIIGPERLPGKIGDAPRSLEKGGPSQAIRGALRKLKATRVRPHPFMQPAFDAELPKAAGLWRNSIK